MRLLGVDFGEVYTGLALGDTETRVATPWKILHEKSTISLVEALQKIMREEGIECVIVGIPHLLHDRQKSTGQASMIRKFILQLRQKGLDVVEEDETWSSKQADVLMRDEKGKRKCDDVAASLILQSYLDSYGVSA